MSFFAFSSEGNGQWPEFTPSNMDACMNSRTCLLLLLERKIILILVLLSSLLLLVMNGRRAR
jgi:hypothetical protein